MNASIGLLGLGLLPLCAGACTLARAVPDAEVRKPVLPVRIADAAAAAPSPPADEPLAHAMPEVSLHLASRLEDKAGNTLRKATVLRVRRTDSVVHIQDRQAGEEWWFRRNPVDPARLAARRVLHSHRLVLAYSDSDLRDTGMPAAFGPLALLGLDSAVLSRLTSDGRTRSAFGFGFRHLASADGSTEVWWSDELRLPLRTVRQLDGGKRLVQEVVGLGPGAEANALRDPALRFPRYLQLDLCDWREENCSCGRSHAPTVRLR